MNRYLLTDEKIKQLWLEEEHRLGFTGETIEDYADDDLVYDRAFSKAQGKKIFSELTKVGKLILDGPLGNIKAIGLEIPWEDWEAFRWEAFRQEVERKEG